MRATWKRKISRKTKKRSPIFCVSLSLPSITRFSRHCCCYRNAHATVVHYWQRSRREEQATARDRGRYIHSEGQSSLGRNRYFFSRLLSRRYQHSIILSLSRDTVIKGKSEASVISAKTRIQLIVASVALPSHEFFCSYSYDCSAGQAVTGLLALPLSAAAGRRVPGQSSRILFGNSFQELPGALPASLPCEPLSV
jgi:hypothetical protein